jgi:hypothetical protein
MRKFGVASTVLVILTEGAVASVDFDSNLSEPKIRALDRTYKVSVGEACIMPPTRSTPLIPQD